MEKNIDNKPSHSKHISLDIENKHNGKKLNHNENLIDQYLTRPSLSKPQVQIIIVTLLVMLVDGINMTMISSFIIPIKSAYKISDYTISVISSGMYIVVGVSSYFTGTSFVNNNKPLIFKASFLLLFISTITMAYFFNLIIFIICRMIHGICIGLLMPLSNTVLCEMMPIDRRSFYLIITGSCIILGDCLNCIIAYLILPIDLNGARLNLVFYILGSIIFFSYLYVEFNLVESPRSLILKGDYEKGFHLLERIINNSNDNFTETIPQEKRDLIIEQTKKANRSTKAEFRSLFKRKYRCITILNIFIWVMNAFILYGSTLILGITFKEIKKETLIQTIKEHDYNVTLILKNPKFNTTREWVINATNPKFDYNFTKIIITQVNATSIEEINNTTTINTTLSNLTQLNNTQLDKALEKDNESFLDKFLDSLLGEDSNNTDMFNGSLDNIGDANITFENHTNVPTREIVHDDSILPPNFIMLEQLTVFVFRMPAMFVAAYMTENRLFGRKNTMTLGYFFPTLLVFVTYFYKQYFSYIIAAGAFFITFPIQASNSYAIEVYPTIIRNLGLGFLYFCYRIAAFVSQPIAVYLTKLDYFGQFYLAWTLCVFGVIFSVCLPYDTLGRNLDVIDDSQLSQEELDDLDSSFAGEKSKLEKLQVDL